MFLIDIAVPRNIEPTVNALDNVFLYDIDDLQKVIETNLQMCIRDRGCLGIHLDCGGKNLAAKQRIALTLGQSLKVELNRLLNVADCFSQAVALRLATFEFWAPSIKAVLVFLNDHACLPSHNPSVTRSPRKTAIFGTFKFFPSGERISQKHGTH